MSQAPTSGDPRRSPPSLPPEVHHDTARIALSSVNGSRPLPGWFWGTLGCFTVLALGLSLMFYVFRRSDSAAASAVPAASDGKLMAPAASAHPAAIQVEPIASPPSPALQPMAGSKPRPPRAIKIARSPGPSPRRAPETAPGAPDEDKAAEPAAAKDDSATEEELLRPRTPTASAGREEREHPAASSDRARPAASNDRARPAASNDRERPAASNDDDSADDK